MGSHLLGDVATEEVRRRERLVAVDDDALLICPWASRSPFELRVIPRRPAPRFEEDEGGAAMIATALRALAGALGALPQLNLWVRTAPRGDRRVLLAHRHRPPADDPRRVRARHRGRDQRLRARARGRGPARGARLSGTDVERCRSRSRGRSRRSPSGSARVAAPSALPGADRPVRRDALPGRASSPRSSSPGRYQVGSFELELHPAIERIVAARAGDRRQRRLRRGLLRGRARDAAAGRPAWSGSSSTPRLRAAAAALAARNGVADRVELRGAVHGRGAGGARRAPRVPRSVIMDCEGAEAELADPERVPWLARRLDR